MFRGALAPRDALVLAGQLGFIAESRFRAATLGNQRFIGWGSTTELLADIHDALVDNSVVTIKTAGGKASRPEPYPRPQRVVEETVTAPTIDDFPIHLVTALTAQK